MRPFISTVVLVMLVLATPACARTQSAGEEGLEEAVAGAQKDTEAAAKGAQEQAEKMQKDAEAAQKQAEQMQKEAEATQEALEQVDYLVQTTAASLPAAVQESAGSMNTNLLFQLHSQAAQAILVIPVEEIKAEDLAAITEDVGIMCRIFDKKLRQEYGLNTSLWDPFGKSTGPEAIYLEGYGVLFLLQVDFPLAPPSEIKEQEPNEQGDLTWEETKRELYSQQEGASHGQESRIVISRRAGAPTRYDGEKVEQLKDLIIKSLKHATNIRNLKPEESVIITIRGCAPVDVILETVETRPISTAPQTSTSRYSSASPSSDASQRGTSRSATTASRKHADLVQTLLRTKDVSGGATIMTIRAKKADIDVFAKGKASFDQFQQRVRINTYSAGGPGTVIQTVQPEVKEQR
jgi:uncharacterized FlaG/YvyC family protein